MTESGGDERRDRVRLILLFVGASALLGGGFTAARIATRELGPVTTAAARYVLTAIALLPIALLRARRGSIRAVLPQIASVTLFGVIGTNVLLFIGLETGTSSNAALTGALAPIFTTLAAAILLSERVARWHWLGLLVCLSGATLLMVGLDPSQAQVDLTVAWFVGSAVCLGLQSVLMKPIIRELGPLHSVLVTSGLSGALLLAPALLIEGAPAVTAPAAAAIFYLGPIMTGLAFTSWFILIDRVGASRSSLIFFAVPLWGTLIAFISGEEPRPVHLVAGALVLLGLHIALRPGSRQR